MRVVHNGLFLTGSRGHTGVGQYSYQLLTALAKNFPKDQHVVVVPDKPTVVLPPAVQVEVVPVRPHLLGRGVALDRWETTAIPAALARLGASIYHSAYPTPLVATNIPVVMTVHDLIPWQFPQYRSGLKTKIRLRRQSRGMVEADHLLTVSQTSLNDLVQLANVHPGKISVTHNALSPDAAKPASTNAVAAVKKRFGLERPYVFYVGGFDYRKNVRGLVAGFGASGLAKTHDLVIAGDLTAPRSRLYEDFYELDALASAAGISKQLKRPGFVSEEDKRALLTGAAVFCYPSLAEGFGIPILEALACGTPVVASRIPSTLELFSKVVATFSTDSIPELAKTLRQTVTNPDHAKVAAGQRLAKRFTWHDTAACTLNAYRQLAG